MKKWVFCFLCSFVLSGTVLSGTEFRLKDRIEKANSGDFFVTEANKMITLAAVRSISSSTLLLEEITIPQKNMKRLPTSQTGWAEWVKARAPGHTSWSMVEIDLKNGELLECYSFSKSAWVRLTQNESLFSTLLQLSLKPIDPERRRRIGPPPLPGESDHRKIWNPPLIADGKQIENAQFDVFETEWPNDGTDIAGKTLILYFDREKRFPLPYWIQIEAAQGSAALRTIDSGKNLPSPYRAIPRRSPEFIGLPQKTATGLRLSLKSPKYYRSFDLFAIDISDPEKEYPIPHSLILGKEEKAMLEIDQKELDEVLEDGHRYTWLAIPVGHRNCCAESAQPFVWNDNF